MAKVCIVTPDRARDSALPPGFARGPAGQRSSGPQRGMAYCNRDGDPIHVHLHRLAAGESLRIGPLASDCVVYVWQGAVAAGDLDLTAGSSAIVEHNARLALAAGEGGAVVLSFAGTQAALDGHRRDGGAVHLLPTDRVPRTADLSGSGVGGGMHADGSCPTCEVWLHENRFPAAAPIPPGQAPSGIHSHSESEVIFVTEGAIRLGQKLFPAGTAVAVAADTLYHIAPGPQGMAFINFRAGTPSDIHFADGRTMSETGFWQERLPRPDYLELA